MTCPNCGAENRPGRKFCGRCGASLALTCPACGALNEPDELYCGECGAALDASAPRPGPSTSASPPAAERRLVSVLFADLVGFTTLSESRDPEEVRDLLGRYFDLARDLIGRYGGMVEKFIGDAVMAVWGTPVAHEDDAERAVRASLDLVEAVAALGKEIGAADLRARAGVLTGEAAVTIGAEGQGMVAGDMVNTASRLQSAASPGAVFVGESTYHAANKGVAFEDAGMHELKGKTEPIQAYRALRVVAGTGGLRRTETLEAPFVGREEELRLIKDLFHATIREGRPRLVSVTGIGGIGKSRLAWEFFKYIDGLVDAVYWHAGRSPAYGEGVTFWPVAEMVRMRTGIAETEDPESSRAKLEASLTEFLTDPEERRWVESALAQLLGLEEKAPGEREELLAAWRTFFERLGDTDPVVLLFEDLQWADPGTMDFIESVLEWSRRSPIFVLTLARPELADRRPTWGAGRRSFTSLHLEPLAEAVMRELLVGLVPGLPDPLVAQILERAEGVPLYAVETVRMLLDRGAVAPRDGGFEVTGPLERLEVPDTLHALIAARLDGLDPGDRRLLQDAAVAGKTFTLAALAGVTGRTWDDLEPRLRELVRKELLVLDQDPRSPERGQYGFIQSLIREVAYQTLSKRDRRAKHLAAAHYFESLSDPELASAIATHYIEAYEATPEGPEAQALAARARDALLVAGERAASLGSPQQALAYVEQALQVTPDSEERAGLWERAAESAQQASVLDRAEEYLRTAVDWYGTRGDDAKKARLLAQLADVVMDSGRPAVGVELLRAAVDDLGDVPDDPSLKVRLASKLARAYMLLDDEVLCAEWADRALVGAERLNLLDVVADTLISKGTAYCTASRWWEGMSLLRGARSLAEQADLIRDELRATANMSFLLTLVDPGEAFRVAVEGMPKARRLGFRFWEVGLAENAACAAVSLGEWEPARALVAGVDPDSLQEGSFPHAIILEPLALLEAGTGRLEVAKNLLGSIRPTYERSSDPVLKAALLRTEAFLQLCSGELEEAFDLALETLSTDRGVFGLQTSGTVGGHSAVWLRDPERCRTIVASLQDAHGSWIDLARETVGAGLAALEGRPQEAAEAYREAAEGLRNLGCRFDLALCHLDRVTLLPEEPGAEETAAEARLILEGLRAAPFLERLAEAVASPEASLPSDRRQ